MILSRGLFAFLTFLMLEKRMSVSSEFSDVQPAKSICRQYHRINETKEVSYVEEYYRTQWGGLVRATRVNFRKDVVTKWMVVEMCCEGYEPSQNTDESPEHCVPVCPSECHNGVCERPNSCLCNPGYVTSVDKITRISECLPECSSGCVGGRCVAPETCSCNPGYDLAEDSTHCKPSCRDIVAGGPEHCGDQGVCIAPNACQCQDGYGPADWIEMNHRNHMNPEAQNEDMINVEKPTFHYRYEINCVPICMPECPNNAACSAPDTCHCNLGYRPDDEHRVKECHPICAQTCHNGFCVHPNVCECYSGYKANGIFGSNLCEPVCQDECVNGECILPDQCQCLSGYEKLTIRSADHTESINVSANVCVATCHSGCGNGTCVAPNQCHCNPGYVVEYDYNPWDTNWQTCRPLCNPACNEGSDCIAPNKCSCEPGFGLSHGSTSCKPSCIDINAGGPENCGNTGICVAPNECQCQDGYAPLHWVQQNMQTTNRSKPIFRNSWEIDCFPACERPCPKNAACIAPNKCHCVTGYQPNNLDSTTECSPICDPPCIDGFCEHPNVCRCHDGYKANSSLSSNHCEPVCQDGCVNGVCLLPNLCLCLPGYEKLTIRNSENVTTFSPNVCNPLCYPECGNGTCVEPNKCNCDHGYVANENNYWGQQEVCEPVCNPSCHDELYCAAPDHCQLFDTNAPHLQTFQARIVEFSSKECGHNGSFAETNGTCMCDYQSDVRKCTESFFCAIIIVDETESAEEFRLLEKAIVLDRTSHVPELYQSAMACQHECRISIFSNESLENIRNDTEQCYTINLHDSKTGLVSSTTKNLVQIGGGKKTNGSFICFVDPGFRCDIPKYEKRRTGGVVGAGVIAGGVFLAVIVLALALSIYLSRRKIQKLFGGLTRKDETMMERSEATESPFHTDDASHL